MSILDQITAVYSSAKYYKDHGSQKMVMFGINGEQIATSTISFQTQMNGKDQFDFSYTKLDQKGNQVIKGIIQKEEAKQKVYTQLEQANGDLQELNIPFKEAIAMHTGISNQLSYLVPSLIYGKELSGSQFYEGVEVQERECKKAGEQCIELAMNRKIRPKPFNIETFRAFAKENKIDEKYLAVLEKNEKVLSQMSQEVQEIEEQSRYYFRLEDLLLIRQEKTLQIGDNRTEIVTNYEPELS